MGVKEQLVDDLKEAMKAHEAARVSAVRMLRAAIQTMEVARTDPKDPKHGDPITELDYIMAIQREVSQRRESIDFARKAGRDDLVANDEEALAAMVCYLPAELSREEIVGELTALIADLGKDFRKVMPVASAQFRGRANGKLVAEIVRELTQP